MAKFKIDTVFSGFPGRAEFWGFGWGAVYLVRTEGDNILVDTGSPAVLPYFEAELKKFGLAMGDINRVFITHIHWDHAYNIEHFPQAEFIYSQTDYDFVVSRASDAAFFPALAVLDRSRRVVVTQENQEVFPGGRAVFLPGHTPGSLGLVLDNDGQTVVLTGDAVKNRLDLTVCLANNNAADAISSGSIKKVKSMADLVYPGHDGPLKVENGQVVALGGNDVKILMPKGLLVNGRQELVLHIEQE